MRDELRAAKTNRDAAAALVIFTPAHAPAGIAPFDVRAGDVYAVIDPADPDPATLQAAVRLARLLALTSLRENEAEVDLARGAGGAHGHPRGAGGHPEPEGPADEHQHDVVGVSAGLDKLREAVLAWIARADGSSPRSRSSPRADRGDSAAGVARARRRARGTARRRLARTAEAPTRTVCITPRASMHRTTVWGRGTKGESLGGVPDRQSGREHSQSLDGPVVLRGLVGSGPCRRIPGVADVVGAARRSRHRSAGAMGAQRATLGRPGTAAHPADRGSRAELDAQARRPHRRAGQRSESDRRLAASSFLRNA